MTSKANEPAYPQTMYNGPSTDMYTRFTGPTMREKLAMEIYARLLVGNDYGATADHKSELADYSLRAADIFFEQLNK